MSHKTIGIILVIAISPFLIDEAFATMNVTERYEDYEVTEIADRVFKSSLGLTKWIQDYQGTWVERLVDDNVNGTKIESGVFSFYYDKGTCELSVFDIGTFSQYTSTPIIKSNSWLIKSTLNGTNNWADLPQNFLPCNVVIEDNASHTMITVTRSDANGIFTQTYEVPKPIDKMKTTLSYTNNDPALNGTHKFAFTNILTDVPDHLTILLRNQTLVEGDLVDLPEYFHYSTSPSTVPFFYDPDKVIFINGTIDIPRSDFFIYPDVLHSLANETGSLTTGFEMHYFSQWDQEIQPITYYFVENDSMDKISNVKLINGITNVVQIDYMNSTDVLNTGDTLILDPPITSQLTETDIKSVTMRSNTFFGAGIRCRGQADFNFGSDFIYRLDSIGGMIGGRNSVCTASFLTFDLSSIPDIATIQQVDFSYNVTTMSFPFQWTNRWALGITEPVAQGLTGIDIASTIFVDSVAPNVDFTTVNLNLIITQQGYSPLCGVTTFTPNPCPIFTSFVDPSAVTDFVETSIESGKDFMLWITCSLNTSFTELGGGCGRGQPREFSTTRLWIGDPVSIQLDITWDIFTPPSEVQNLIATFSASPDTCTVDWDLPADLGGGLLLGNKIERSINSGSFVTLVADTGTPLPTLFTDTAIVADESYRYRVSASNDQGFGTTAISNSCGIPVIADPPVLLALGENPINQIELNWLAPNFDGGLPIDGYKIERSSSGDPFIILVTDTGNTNIIFNDGTAQGNILFAYRISTINSLGTSIPSNEQSFTIVVTAGGAGVSAEAPVPPPPEPVFPQEEFDQALAEALAKIPPQQVTVIETIIQTFFEFAVVDTSHEDLVLNSFLSNERLGIRWSSGQDIVVVSAVPALSPFLITFEQLPAVKQGSGAVISTDFLLYNLQVPRNACVAEVTMDCVEKLRYEVPVVVNAIINGTNVSDVGTITVDLVDEFLDPILLLILATFGIPLIGVFVQRRRGRKAVPPVGDVFKT